MDMNQLKQIGDTSQSKDGHLARKFLLLIDKTKKGELPAHKVRFELRKLVAHFEDDFENKDYIISVISHITNRQTDLSSL